MSPHARRLLAYLLLLEVGLVLAHCLRFLPVRVPGVYLLDLDGESTLPAWFSSVQLFAIAVAAAALLWLDDAARRGPMRQAGWVLLACTFAFLSVDESVQIHEIFDRRRDLFPYKWCVYYAPAMVLVGGACSLFLYRHLRRGAPHLRLFVAGSGVLVGGAMGLEAVAHGLLRTGVRLSLVYDIEIVCEEFLEMIGASVILCTFLSYGEMLFRERFAAVGAPGPSNVVPIKQAAVPHGAAAASSPRPAA